MENSRNTPKNIPQTDENVPALAKLAVEQAYREAVAAGRSITKAEGGKLVEVMPNGAVREIKLLEPATKATPGQTYSLR